MRYTVFAVAAAAFLQLTGAQATTDTATSASESASVTGTASGAGSTATVDPAALDPSLKGRWCGLQQTVCRELCPNQNTETNTCDALKETLEWTCTCPNNIRPNVSDYANTIPSQSCLLYQNQCASNSSDAQFIAENCRSFVCGSKGTTGLQSSYSASSESASSTSSGEPTGSATGSSTAETASETGAAVILELTQSYGLAGIICALGAAFGLAL